jgi:hypothetical protein
MSTMDDDTGGTVGSVSWTKSKGSRRNFMARVGGVALIAAALVVTKASPASAYPCGCCNLAYTRRCPVNWCLFNGDWVWYCGSCTCCEAHWTRCSASQCC